MHTHACAHSSPLLVTCLAGSGAGQTKSISLSEVLKMNIKVENYNLDKEVGGGRFGRVFSAVDTESKTTVAIKSLKLEVINKGVVIVLSALFFFPCDNLLLLLSLLVCRC